MDNTSIKIHHCVQHSLSMATIMSQINPVHILPSYSMFLLIAASHSIYVFQVFHFLQLSQSKSCSHFPSVCHTHTHTHYSSSECVTSVTLWDFSRIAKCVSFSSITSFLVTPELFNIVLYWNPVISRYVDFLV
jgi:hypothetical protein